MLLLIFLTAVLSMEVAREGNLMSVCGPVLQAVVELRRHSAEPCHQRDDARHVECSSLCWGLREAKEQQQQQQHNHQPTDLRVSICTSRYIANK